MTSVRRDRPDTRTMHRAVRASRVTCRWCTEPTMGSLSCRHCADHHRIAGVADVVVPLVYAIAGSDSAALLRDYKQHPALAVRSRCTAIIGQLVRDGVTEHGHCIETVVGQPITVRTHVPSLTFRPGLHPFARAMTDAGLAISPVLAPAPEARCDRAVSADKFIVRGGSDVAGRHVLVLDDVWTTGSNAQSAVLTLCAAGAAAVSVMVVGRWLNPSYPPTARFLDRHLVEHADPPRCPVTGKSLCANARPADEMSQPPHSSRPSE